MTRQHWLALAVVGSGLTGLTAMGLFAKGRREEALALALTSGLLSTTFAAARVLGAADAAPSVASGSGSGGASAVKASDYGMAGLLGVRAIAR
jgi:hypothetical protein